MAGRIAFAFLFKRTESVTLAVWVTEATPLKSLPKARQSKPNQEAATTLDKSSREKETGNFDLCLFV